MNSIDVLLFPLQFLARLFFLGASIIAPIVFLIFLISALHRERFKKAGINLLCLLLSIGLAYSVYADIEVPARVDIKSIEENYDKLLALDEYQRFDTGYIYGDLFVYDSDDKDAMFFREQKAIADKYVLNNGAVCYITPVRCVKDERISHLLAPMYSFGDIIIETPERTFHIDYYYESNTFFNLLWPITNPEVVYRHKIDIADIIETNQ